MLETIFCKFSNDRCPAYAIMTKILTDEAGKKYVEKVPATKEAAEHVEKIYQHEFVLEKCYQGTVLEPNHTVEIEGRRYFEYVEGKTLTQTLDEFLEEGQTNMFWSLFEQYASLVKGTQEDLAHNLDLIPDNILIKDGRWIVIDYEWTFEKKISAEFVLFRGIHYYIGYPSDIRCGLEGKELYSRFGMTEEKIEQYFQKEQEFQKYIDQDYVKLETLKYLYNRRTADVNRLLEEGEKHEKQYPAKAVFYHADGTVSRTKDLLLQTDHYDTALFQEKLEENENSLRLYLDTQNNWIHLLQVNAFRAKDDLKNAAEKEIPLAFDMDGQVIGEFNVFRMMEGNSVSVTVPSQDYRIVVILIEFLYLSDHFKAAMEWKEQSERDRIQSLEKKIGKLNAMMEIVQFRQDQVRKLIDLDSVHYLGRAMEKIHGNDPIRALRPPLAPDESGIRFYIDEIQYRSYGLFVRGWVFHEQEFPVSIYVRDENGKELPIYIQKTIRDDVAGVFQIAVEAVNGFALSIDRSLIKTEHLILEFETIGGYLATDILSYGRKEDEEEWEKHLQDFSDYFVEYDYWAYYVAVDEKELKKQRKKKFPYHPLISVVVPLYNTPIPFLRDMMESVLGQSYSMVELCMADGSEGYEIEQFITEHYGQNLRVKYRHLSENKGISDNTVAAAELAGGEFIMLCDHDDIVTPDACYELVKALNMYKDTDVVYSDEDKVTMDGKRFYDPHFKPDFNLEFLRSNNYICHIFLVRKSICDSLDRMFRPQFDGAQDYDFIFRCCEKARRIVHVPKVLYHWRAHPLSTAGNPESKEYAYESGRSAIEESYKRANIPAKVTRTKNFGRYRTEFSITTNPSVEIIINASDQDLTAEIFSECLASIAEQDRYQNFNVQVVLKQNRMDLKEIVTGMMPEAKVTICSLETEGEDCSSIAYNYGAQNSDSDYLLFLDGAVRFRNSDWMKEMLSYCIQKEVAVCGGKIVDPDNVIWHGGVVIGMNGSAGRLFDGISDEKITYQFWADSTRNVSAVSGICMMISREIFRQLKGFDSSMGRFYDVDLCLCALAKGYSTVYNPYAELVYALARKREDSETAFRTAFCERWKILLEKGDPCYNSNLSLSQNDCRLRELTAK